MKLENKFFFIIIIASILVMFAAVIATPTLSYDDLLLAKDIPQYLASNGWGKTAWRFLTMADIGQSEMRTYGLTRAIQLVTVSLFGASPALTMGFIIGIHAASGLLIYFLLIRTLEDRMSSTLLAIAWVASPAVIPFIRTEHHWLYLITPYYALIGWVVLNGTPIHSVLRFCMGSILLTSVWFLGEAPIIPLLLVSALWVLSSPNLKSAIYYGGQALISIALLGVYLTYQFIFINNPNGPHRFVFKGIWVDGPGYFFGQLLQNAKGILGLPYREADLGMHVPSFQVTDNWEVWAYFVVLLAMWFFTMRLDSPRSRIKLSNLLVSSIWLMWVGSLSIYFILTLFGASAFPIRYTAAFFLFMPIALTLGVAVISRNLLFTRSTASIAACFTVAFSTFLTLKYEYSINTPNRNLLAKVKEHGLIVYDPQSPGFVRGSSPTPLYAGITPITSPGYGDPVKSFWTLSPMLELYAGAVVGSECRLTQDGMVQILQGQQVIGIRPEEQVLIMGTDKMLDQICSPP
jgi:hypothetical protein